ncbi:MAG: valine--tRNA ligase [Bacteroidales bacterium]|jgi:valyl-tRNA synthetase|nr:valine--tRNA ligase [Bacteroidales bacterium]
MELPSKYDPKATEDKWYAWWMQNKMFESKPDNREPYTIVIPPPNVTGVLHMGHMLNNTIQDVLVRRARMMGKNACWVPGTDHASIATEAKVVAKLASEGIHKTGLTRGQFLEHAWEWTHRHGGIILEQLKKLGASCDWSRTCFTMDENLSKSVFKVFVDLYNKNKIYRGVRMVNWDPKAQTALSDEEVIYKEVQSKLYYLKYYISPSTPDGGRGAYMVIATTRPETILGDTAVCVNPNDPRYMHLHGRHVIVPLIGRCVPVIPDAYVDMEFGTGALKITPAHDVNDYILGEKYNLESIDIFNDDGTLNERAQRYVGQDRFDVRQQIEIDLREAGLLEKTEDYTNKVGFSERTDAVIEPKLSMQWFVSMEDLSKPALRAVMDDVIELYPPKFKNTYRHWMENIKDWCISRQLWWGHRIPAWYMPQGGFVVAENGEEALKMARERSGNPNLVLSDLRQDEDCLDTWFSSWLWPVSVFDGINRPDNPDIKYYYPTNDLVTAPEILFFWVARMIIAGYEYMGDKPFRNVYLTGIVRDKLGRKMSKQLGNSPDPLVLIDNYGADGVRLGMLLTSPAGNDLPFDELLCEQGRNFNNKIWNAFRLVKGWQVDGQKTQPVASAQAVEWFDALLNRAIADIDDQMGKYRLSEALMATYKLFWDEFSAWYLEMIKPGYQQPIDGVTFRATLDFFEKLLLLLHPFMPFITEELWRHIKERGEHESIMVAAWPVAGAQNPVLIDAFEQLKETVAAVRNIRQDKNIPNREALQLMVNGAVVYPELLGGLCNLSGIASVTSQPEGAIQFMVRTTEYFVPLAGKINVEEEIRKLEAELKHQEGFLASVMKKLGNERFVSSAPARVVETERKKQADTESRIQSISQQLANLKG